MAAMMALAGKNAAMLDMSLDSIISAGYGKLGADKKVIERVMPYDTGGPAALTTRRVFVGNLPYSVSWQDLKDHMRSAGKVLHCDIIAQPGTAMGSKGCGLVEYATREEAAEAIRTLSDTKINGRPIFVREDRDAGKGGAPQGHLGPSKPFPVPNTANSGGADARSFGGGRRVFVGNLPYSVTWKELKDHMRSAGDVAFCDIMAEPGTAMGSKGCGLVEYATSQGAQRAIQDLTETTIKGRPIYVREDREEAKGPELYGKGASKGLGSMRSCRVFVGNLPYSITWRELKDHMRAAGDVVHCDIIAQPGTTCGSKGCGLVQYASADGARHAIRHLSDSMLGGRPIFVREDREG